MDFLVVDSGGVQLAYIDDYTSAVVNEKAYAPSTLKIEISRFSTNASELKPGNFVVTMDSPSIVFLLEYQETDDEDEEYTLAVRGKEVGPSVSRVVIPPSGETHDEVSSMAAETALYHYVDNHIGPAASSSRSLDRFRLATDEGKGLSVSVRSRYEQLADVLYRISQLSGLGWQTVYDGSLNEYEFQVYQGSDLSGQVIFSVDFDATLGEKVLHNEQDWKTYAFVAGQGEGANREVVETYIEDTEPTSYDRREAFIDARDVKNTEGSTTVLTQRGDEMLEDNKPEESFEIKVNPLGSFVFRQHWDIGDLVLVRSRDKLHEKTVRVITVKRTFRRDESGTQESIDTTLARPWPKLSDRALAAATASSTGEGTVDYPLVDEGSNYRFDKDLKIQEDSPTIEFMETDIEEGEAGKRLWLHKNQGNFYFLLDRGPLDFEIGDLSRWDTVNHLSVVQDRVYEGQYAGYSGTSTAGIPLAATIPDPLSGGQRIQKFEYFWQETGSSTGAGIRLINSNGGVELGVASDNPEWDIDDGNGIDATVYAGDGYDRWVRFTITFDWDNGTFDVDFEDLTSGSTYVDTGRPLKQGVDVEKIQLDEYNGGLWQNNDASAEMWWDKIKFVTTGATDWTPPYPIVIRSHGKIDIATQVEIADPTREEPALKIGRNSGNPSIQGIGDWFIIDSGATAVGLNYYSSGDVILANGGGGIEMRGPTDFRYYAYVMGARRLRFLNDYDRTNSSRTEWYQNGQDRSIIRHYYGGNEKNRIYFRTLNTNDDGYIYLQSYNGSGSVAVQVRLEATNGRTRFNVGDVLVDENFDVSGSKNALIVDPDDNTKAYRFGAMEADEPGLLFHRMLITIPSGETSATASIPEHWARIATDADAMVSPIAGEATEQRDQKIMPHASVDTALPEVTVEGLPGDYRVWILAARADDKVATWEHVTTPPADEEEEEEPA